MIHFLIILKILHTIHATLFLIKLYFSKAVDVFYSTLRARITSKEDHQVLVDRVMNLGCKRTKLLCNLAAGGLCVKSNSLEWFFFPLKVAKIVSFLLKINNWNSATLDISVLDSFHL